MAAEKLKCKECGTTYALEARYVCERFFGPLEVLYGAPDADVETLWRVFESIGSQHGWSAAPPAWALRGWTGRAADVAPRPSSSRQLHAGEALDWWRVEHVDRPRLLRLRADAALPGRLWLELSVRPDGDSRCCYRQRVVFQPYGLAGEVFWRASGWLRGAVFGGIARDISAKASGAEVSARTDRKSVV